MKCPLWLLPAWLVLLPSCAGALGNVSATDPTERGLSYVAATIVTNAVIRSCFH